METWELSVVAHQVSWNIGRVPTTGLEARVRYFANGSSALALAIYSPAVITVPRSLWILTKAKA